MKAAQQLLTEHLAIWTDADTAKRSGRGRSSGNAASVYGVKKLRELILELAVMGKIVPQNVKDEPASFLLKKILVKKVNGSGLEISDEEKLFELPAGWAWSRFGDISEIERGGSPRPIKSFITNEKDGLNWIKIGDTDQGGKYITSTNEKIRKEGLSHTRMVYPGDFLLTNSMSFGRPYITKIQGCIHDGWLRISPPIALDKDFLYLLLSSPYVRKIFVASAAGAVVMNLNAEKVRGIVIPIPPLAEQHRIVAKVDELMALCDQLETQHNNAAEAHEKIVKVLLESLTSPLCQRGARGARGDFGDFFTENWQRIAAHFDTLFTTESSIDALKQTLLQLAVMGKLVPQDANDEPASKLLQCIQAEKAKLVAEGKIKKDKPLEPISDEEKPFDLPSGWEWVSLGSITSIRGGSTPSMAKSEFWGGKIPWVSPKDMHDGVILGSELKITDKALKETNLELVPVGSILIVGRSGILKRKLPAQITAVPCTVNQDIKAVTPIKPLSDRYMQLIFWGNEKEILIRDVKQGTTVQSLVYESLFSRPFALPPEQEQNRIVAKVDELMAICDQLKTRITAANQLQQKLADVVVENALL